MSDPGSSTYRGADAMTDLLRSAWAHPDQRTNADDEPANASQACTLQLNAADASSMAGMTLWDMLSGKYQSRVPGMNGSHDFSARPTWAAWDPCSKYRSRCGADTACVLRSPLVLLHTLPRCQAAQDARW